MTDDPTELSPETAAALPPQMEPEAPPMAESELEWALEPHYVDAVLKNLHQKIADTQEQIAFLEARRDTIEKLGLVPSAPFGRQIDFDNPPREKLLAALLTFGGKWEKCECASDPTAINYAQQFGRINVRFYGAPPPPSCRVVEVEVDMPAIPAHKQIVKKIVCDGDSL